jgi:hypothetical protein
VAVRDTTGGREKNLSSVLKVPGHCPFVLPVAFVLGPRKTAENLDGVSRSQELPDAN